MLRITSVKNVVLKTGLNNICNCFIDLAVRLRFYARFDRSFFLFKVVNLLKNYITHNLNISEESLKKLKVISEYNNRTVEEEVIFLINKCCDDYFSEHKDALNKI